MKAKQPKKVLLLNCYDNATPGTSICSRRNFCAKHKRAMHAAMIEQQQKATAIQARVGFVASCKVKAAKLHPRGVNIQDHSYNNDEHVETFMQNGCPFVPRCGSITMPGAMHMLSKYRCHGCAAMKHKGMEGTLHE